MDVRKEAARTEADHLPDIVDTAQYGLVFIAGDGSACSDVENNALVALGLELPLEELNPDGPSGPGRRIRADLQDAVWLHGRGHDCWYVPPIRPSATSCCSRQCHAARSASVAAFSATLCPMPRTRSQSVQLSPETITELSADATASGAGAASVRIVSMVAGIVAVHASTRRGAAALTPRLGAIHPASGVSPPS